jgi:hypothetical protein
MATITVDFSQVPSQEPVDVGDHTVIVEKVELRDSKSSSNQYLNWDLVDTEGAGTGRHLFLMTSLSVKALWRLEAVCESFGIELDDGERLTLEVDDDTKLVTEPDLVGKVALARVKHEVYDGKIQAKVDEILPLMTTSGPVPMRTAAATGATVPLNGAADSDKKPRLALR